MIIELKGVWFAYPGSRRYALRGVHMRVEGGRVVMIEGPNGAGKTTLLKVLALLYRPVKGAVFINGDDYWSLDPRTQLSLRRRVVYVHERPILLRGSVLENVALGLKLRGVPGAISGALETLRAMGLEYLAERKWRELSAGEAQLVSIARAVAVQPELLLLDEPMAHLDEDRRELLVEILRELKSRGVGIVVASHWPQDELLRIGIDRVVRVVGGEVRAL